MYLKAKVPKLFPRCVRNNVCLEMINMDGLYKPPSLSLARTASDFAPALVARRADRWAASHCLTAVSVRAQRAARAGLAGRRAARVRRPEPVLGGRHGGAHQQRLQRGRRHVRLRPQHQRLRLEQNPLPVSRRRSVLSVMGALSIKCLRLSMKR